MHTGKENSYTLVFVVEQAIMSLMPMRNKPPVSTEVGKDVNLEGKRFLMRSDLLLLTIEMYSSSEGHCRESLQRISIPWPRWRESNSAVTILSRSSLGGVGLCRSLNSS